MYTSLRARLWLTYAIIILLILSILGIGIFVYIIRHPLIDRQALGRLDAALTVIQRQINERSILPRDYQQYLNRISDSLAIRLILFSPEKDTILDSEPESPAIIWANDDLSLQMKGQIDDMDGKTWLYSSWVMPKGDLLVIGSSSPGRFTIITQSSTQGDTEGRFFALIPSSWISSICSGCDLCGLDGELDSQAITDH